jgi:hypothetical protein
VFDLFSPQGLEAWRFHGDPLEMRRPLQQNSGSELPILGRPATSARDFVTRHARSFAP